jgi:hypothetical protein
MSIRNLVLAVSVILLCSAVPAHAQYKEMSKLDSLSRSMPEPDMLNGMATHFGVSVDALKQEKTANNLSFGQLYIAHAIAKASNSSVNSIVSESQNKLWPEIAKEKNVDMKQLSHDADELEKAIKDLQKGKK